MIRTSSKEAYATVIFCNADAKCRKQIIDYMKKRPDVDYTRNELCIMTGISINRITPRVLELIKSGDLEELPRRKSPFSSVLSHSVRLSDKQLKAAA